MYHIYSSKLSSYYAGWLRGEHYFQLKTEYANCYSLSPELDCIKPSGNNLTEVDAKVHPMINYWIENKLSIFGDVSFNNKNLELAGAREIFFVFPLVLFLPQLAPTG